MADRRAAAPTELEAEIGRVGRALHEAFPSHRGRPLKALDDRAMDLAAQDEELRAALFRFVDVVPACRSLDDLAAHLTGFLDEVGEQPPSLRAAMRMGDTKAGRAALGAAGAAGVRHMAHRFIVGEDPRAALPTLRRLWRDGIAASVDLLGEATVTAAEADRYAARCDEALRTLAGAYDRFDDNPLLERDAIGSLPRANLSVKVSALTPLLRPEAPERGQRDAAPRLRALLRRAHELGAHLHIDMESLDSREAVLELVLDLLAEAEFADGPSAGVVLQAYLRDSPQTLDTILGWSGRTPRAHPLVVRLVKGAYWDHEVVEARQHGWSVPVFERKADCDANFEALTARLLEARPLVRVAIASHNLRSVSHAIARNRMLGGAAGDVEFQVLRGLGDDLGRALAASGLRVRSYCPVGDLVAGMAYLVRRLLENTANDSFLADQAQGVPLEQLLGGARGGDVVTVEALPPFRNEPVLELRRVTERAKLAVGMGELRLPLRVPVWIGEERREGEELVSTDPGRPERAVALAASATPAEAAAAVEAAQAAFGAWAATPVAERAAALLRAAAWMRERRASLAALALRECAKPWPEADADVCEAIDFLEFYARAAIELQGGDGPELLQVPGERNELHYAPRGVCAVIAPWNFPLAIPTGMAAAALATGNTVVLKPAEQAPGCGLRVLEALRAGGVPAGAIALLPGAGDAGAALAGHPDVATIAFTGSGAVGLELLRTAAEVPPGARQLTRVVAEMGGKNCIIVDSDADLDEAIPAIVESAFDYAGQKCSAAARVLVHEALHDELVERLTGAVAGLQLGPADDFATDVPPVVEREAQERVRRYADLAARTGEISTGMSEVPGEGWYVAPVVATGLPADSPLLREEIFGPLLTVEPVRNVDDACDRVDALPVALTGGLFSRNPRTVAHVVARSPVGNLYVNRSTTGAMVGRQPFGGNRLSGTGTKAGGPDYLLHFVEPRVVTENTVRHGLVV